MTNPLDQIQALTTARTEATKALSALPGPGAPSQVENRFAVQLAERLAAGEPLPDDLVEQYAAERRANEDRAAIRGVLQTTIGHLRDLIADAERQAVPYRLAALGEELAGLVDATRKQLHRLGTARTAEDAIAQGVAEAWQQIHTLGARYGALRTRQVALVGEATGDGHAAATRIKRHGIIANLREVWPDAVKWDANERGEPAPWPHEQGRPYDTPHGREFLIWLAETPEAQPWVPTVAQLDQADRAAVDALTEHNVSRSTRSKTNDAHTYPMGRTA